VPFVLQYRAFLKIIEVNALSTAVEQIQNLETVSAQISAATNQWAAVQESVGGEAAKTSAAAREIAERMTAEVLEFSEFMQKMNDSEKTALRLEVEKFRRGETEWLQTLVRVLDHIFALYSAASRAGQPKIAEQIAHFQSACRGVVRRVGLAVFVAEAGQPFDAQCQQVADGVKPSADSVIGETVGAGYTFQGKLLRPALVKLRDKNLTDEIAESSEPATNAEELPLQERERD
jgi:molecular chaperone GrpE (heat shock protein)